MKKVIIFGGESFSELLYYYLTHDSEYKVEAFTVHEKYIAVDNRFGLPVISFENIERYYKPTEYEIFLGIGYKKMNSIRRYVYFECKKKGYTIATYIHSSTILNEAEMGEGNIILEKNMLEPFVKIGRGNLIWYNVSIAHNDVIGDFNTIAGSTSISGNVIIENNCFLGTGCVVFNDITIRDYTLVGGGAIVNKDTQKNEVIVPPRSITLVGKNSIDIL